MRAVDSGVAIAAFASWHEAHSQAHAELADRPQIAAHAMLETFSVLTRLPLPHRASGSIVADFLVAAFPADPLSLSAGQQRELIAVLAQRGVVGGATYDALIAETVRRARGLLVTLDERAQVTYERIGCPSVLLH
ncbi:MAG: VapC toxin family PIN domain ribonuclease [Nocardioidaceae bacterium]|nr:VapC toxin family PIN domain ribonuclease [Nocardioidaceae bacterium]